MAQQQSESKRKTKKRKGKPRMSAGLASKLEMFQNQAQKREQMHTKNKKYQKQTVGKLERDKFEKQLKGKEYEIKLNEVSKVTKDQITAATTYKTVGKNKKGKNEVHKISDVAKYEEGALQHKKKLKEESKKNEEILIKSLRKEKEKERTLRLKTNQQLAMLQKLFSGKLKAMNVKFDDLTDSKFKEIQKQLHQTEAAQGNMQYEMERLETENAEIRMKIKEIQRKSPMTKKSMILIEENVDERSRKILSSNQTEELCEGVLLDYSKKHKRYEERWAKLTNDGELLLFKNKSAEQLLKTFDLVSEYIGVNKTDDTEFELISSSNESCKLRTETEDVIGEWMSNIKVTQYFFKVKTEQTVEDDMEYDDDVKEEVETDPFWLDIADKMKNNVTKDRIKESIPGQDTMDPSDPKNNKWKEVLWKAEYGDFELSCNARLTCYDTGKLNEDENNILYASVSKYGINSYGSWHKIADNLNREVSDVMKKYSKLVGIPVKQLKKTAIARR